MSVDPPSSVPPDVAQLFEDLTWMVWERDFDRYSADAILHQIRWQYQVVRGHRDFKCNNNWTPYLARWMLKKYPAHLKGFFEIRVLKRMPQRMSPHDD